MNRTFAVVDAAEYRLVTVRGDIDDASVDDFRAACAFQGPVVVDLLGCSYIDSSGLSALVVRNRTGNVALVLTPDCRIYRIFEITRLLQYFHIAGTTHEAISLLNRLAATERTIED